MIPQLQKKLGSILAVYLGGWRKRVWGNSQLSLPLDIKQSSGGLRLVWGAPTTLSVPANVTNVVTAFFHSILTLRGLHHGMITPC